MSHFETRAIKVKNRSRTIFSSQSRSVCQGFFSVSHCVWLFISLMMVCTCGGASIRSNSVSVQLDGEDSCDWKGSGFDSGDSRSVRPVYLRCSQGRVQWDYPRGALRIQLRSGHGDREFQGCIKIRAPFYGARIYVEGHRTLRPLVSPEDAEKRSFDLPRCFSSRSGLAALYLEADLDSSLQAANGTKKQVRFHYDLQNLEHSSGRRGEECRPCDDNELVQSFCNSDFVHFGTEHFLQQQARSPVECSDSPTIDNEADRNVREGRSAPVIETATSDAIQVARGRIISVTKNSALQRNEIEVLSSRLFRQTGATVFVPEGDGRGEAEESRHRVEAEGVDPPRLRGTLFFPGACLVRPTLTHDEEYLFMGRLRLGDPYVKCAPRLQEWVRIMRKAEEEGTAVCALAA